MEPISIRFLPDLHKALVKKSKEMGGLNLSDTIRILLRSVLDDKKTKVKNKQFQYIAATYYLLNDYILNLEEKGVRINKKAHEKAEKIAADLLN